MHFDTANHSAAFFSGQELSDSLRQVFGTSQHVKVYTGNGQCGWQIALENVLSEGDVAVLLDSKGVAHLWGMSAESSGIKLQALSASSSHEPVAAEALEQCLREDVNHQIKAVMAMHTETEFTVQYDLPKLRAAIDAAGHPALFMVDCVSTFGCARLEMDAWGMDVVVAESQQGLMMPAGLAILGISEKAIEFRKRKRLVPANMDWLCGMNLEPFGHWLPSEGVPWMAPDTPPTHLVSGLHASLDILLKQHGLERAWARHETFARATWAAVDAWGQGSEIRCFVPEEEHRSLVATLVKVEGLHAERLRQWCRTEAKLLLPCAGVGYSLPCGQGRFQEDGALSDSFRIGHMGYSDAATLLGTLGAIDCAFKALGVPHGGNAVGAAAEVVAASWNRLSHNRA